MCTTCTLYHVPTNSNFEFVVLEMTSHHLQCALAVQETCPALRKASHAGSDGLFEEAPCAHFLDFLPSSSKLSTSIYRIDLPWFGEAASLSS